MRKSKPKKILFALLLVLAAYLLLGNLLHRVVFAEKKPDVATYFRPGQVMYSRTEGFRQTVLKQEAGLVHVHLTIDPFAAGPPRHLHDSFDESFAIENGELTVWVDGEIKKLRPGEVLHIPKGTPHQPYNETADTIRLKGSFPFPEKFAFNLLQVYGYADEHPDFASSPKTVLQMALFQGAGFDSYIADGPPVAVQKTLGFVVSPLARLLGYQSYYPAYGLHENNRRSAHAITNQPQKTF